jgi:DNA replication and repair protein RecF
VLRLSALHLENFRSYDQWSLKDLEDDFIALIGPNGIGKTNILDAISLLSPGKGLRQAESLDHQNKKNPHRPWIVSTTIESDYGSLPMGVTLDLGSKKKNVFINGVRAKNQKDMQDYLSCLWLTPQMDRLFQDASSGRRKFLDRMVFVFDPSHAGRLTRYEKAMQQRARVLKNEVEKTEISTDIQSWLKALERQMAETSVAIATARLDFIERLQIFSNQDDGSLFPKGRYSITGFVENLLIQGKKSLEVEDCFQQELLRSRAHDSLAGGALHGIHKSDFVVVFADKNMPADLSSTGEQKALLIGIILAHGAMMKEEKGQAPLLLLDEVAAHLDSKRRAHLYQKLSHLNAQIWLTGTEETLFAEMPEKRLISLK